MPRITQAGIHDLILEHATSRNGEPGSSVLRLKSGDPLIFGRAGEEIAFLRQHNLPFEIVPGITTAFSVAAALQTPLTDRTSASRLIFATAHHAAGKVDITPEQMWRGSFPDDATLVLYMPGRDFTTLSASLISSGIPPATPCVAVSKASTHEEQITTTTIADLPTATIGPAPLILLIGHAIQIPTNPQ
jgi:uroporphyrin-III C-methyltransferase